MRWCVLVALVGCAGGSPRDPSQEGTDDPAVLALQAEVRQLRGALDELVARVDAGELADADARARLDAVELPGADDSEPTYPRGAVVLDVACDGTYTPITVGGYRPQVPGPPAAAWWQLTDDTEGTTRWQRADPAEVLPATLSDARRWEAYSIEAGQLWTACPSHGVGAARLVVTAP